MDYLTRPWRMIQRPVDPDPKGFDRSSGAYKVESGSSSSLKLRSLVFRLICGSTTRSDANCLRERERESFHYADI